MSQDGRGVSTLCQGQVCVCSIASRVKVGILWHMTVETPAATASPWVPTAETFAARLALIRQRMGWNIKEAARACGQPPATWRLWEIDGAQPRNIVAICKAIAGATGCDYLWLLLGPDGGRGPATVR
jgi:hypothetical protein